MLTIRLKLNGIATAFQTNSVISLLKKGDDEFESIRQLFPETATEGIVDIEPEINRRPTTYEPRSYPVDIETHAIVKLDGARGEHMTAMGSTAYPDGARFICLGSDDSVLVLDSGAVLFKWPAESNAAGHS